ncbi:MAG: hypothetical protein ACRYFX_07325 [Janthinobacterium lividum]
MKKTYCRPISLTDARTHQRIRVSHFAPGAALVPVCHPMPILGYWSRQVGHLTRCSVYVAGTMPPLLRTAAELGRTDEEIWLSAAPGGIREIDLTDCRNEFEVLLPTAQVA